MNLIVLKNKIFVEVVAKRPVKQDGALFAEVEVTHSLGVVTAIGEDYEGSLKLNDKVCYGAKREQIRISGKDMLVMDPDNIFGIIKDSDEGSKAKE